VRREDLDTMVLAEVANWDAWGGDDGLQHINVVRTQVTPEEAVSSVMDRAREKYGPAINWARWRFRVVEFGQGGPPRTIHFRMGENGRAARLDA
jgi:hypothetical protein